MISMTFASFYGVPVHRSRTIVFIYRQADPRGVTYLWYSRGLSSPPYTDTGMSHQCSDRCPHSYTASSWYTRSHLQFNREREKPLAVIKLVLYAISLSNIVWSMCFALLHCDTLIHIYSSTEWIKMSGTKHGTVWYLPIKHQLINVSW